MIGELPVVGGRTIVLDSLATEFHGNKFVETRERTAQSWRFGVFEVNSRNMELRRGGARVKLREQSFSILILLLEHAGEVVTREELRRVLWPSDTFVDFDHSLNAAVMKLREALGDSADKPLYIETIPKRGYRFVAPVSQEEPPQARRAEASGPSGPAVYVGSDLGPAQATFHAKISRRRWRLVVPVAAAALVLLVSAYFHFRRHAMLTDKDTIVLADFTDSTSDLESDGMLRQGLSIQLEQSPFLSITSDQRIRETLKMMGQPADAKLTPAIARELCQRTGSAAVLDGSIVQVGTGYLLTLRAVNCSSGESLASTEAQASDKNHVLDALGKIASEMRNQLGESLSTVRKFDTPLEEASTSSLEALKAYSLGRKAMQGSEFAGAVPFLARAILLDPNFAMAYARLGTCYLLVGEPTLASENTRKAYELRESVSDLEKFYIESHYYQQTTGELEKARQVYKLWAQSYPRDWARASAETAVSAMSGQDDEGLAESREELGLNPTGEGYGDLLFFYVTLNRLDEAQSAVEEAQAKNFDSPFLRGLLYKLRFLQNDAAGMSQQVDWAASKPGAEDALLDLESKTAAYSGRLEQARDLSRRAMVSAQRAGKLELAAGYEADAALRESLFGNPAEVRERCRKALDLSNSADVESLAALASSIAGDSARAETLAEDLGKRFPQHTIVQSYYLPTVRAQLALSHNDRTAAIEVLHAAAPYELSSSGALYPVYVRGQSYLAAHRGDEASAEFQKILDHRGIVVNAPVGALAYLGLGRAYALSGDKTRAKIAYQDFLSLWKDAEPDIPILKQAKVEYGELN